MSTQFDWQHGMRACCLGLGLAFAAYTPAVQAAHDLGLFELDRNAISEAAPGEDWDAVLGSGYAGPGTPTQSEAPFEAVAGFPGLLYDPSRASGGNNVSDMTIFTTGGSKDTNDISKWRWTSGNIPDKDDIVHAYAVAYPGPSDHLVVYFGLDRFANNGDAQIGFWFTQDDIQLAAGGTFTDGVGGATAQHKDGDLLILANFTNGGSIGTVDVYSWEGDGINGHLDTTPIISGGDCDSAAANDIVCALVNHSDTQAPWPFTPKFGTAGYFPQGSFFEGGIDLTALYEQVLQKEPPCFTAFLAETRSSQSPTAQLKDLVLGRFPVCGLTVGKACAPATVEHPNPVFDPNANKVHTVFNVPITNTGFGKLYDITIKEGNLFTDPLLDAAGDQCSLTAVNGGAITPIQLVAYGVAPTEVKVADTLSGAMSVTVECDSKRNNLSNTIYAKAKTSSTATVFALEESHMTSEAETCGLALTSEIEVTKSCKNVTMIGGVTPNVCVNITVANKSEQDVNVTYLHDAYTFGQDADVLNSFLSANGSATLRYKDAPSGSATTFEHCYTPTDNTLGAQDPAVVQYSDTATVKASGAYDNKALEDTSNTANCSLCPAPAP